MVARVDALTPDQEARMPAWRDRWIATGLSTEPMDLERFSAAANACYRYAGLAEPAVTVPVSSPLVLALAAPVAARLLSGGAVRIAVGVAVVGAVSGAVREAVGAAVSEAVDEAVGGAVSRAADAAIGGAVRDAVRGAVHDAVRGAVHDAVGGAVGVAVVGAVGAAVREAVGAAVSEAVDEAVGGAVHDAVGGAVGDAVHGAVDVAVGGAVGRAVGGATDWYRYIGGQFWVGGWWGSPAVASYYRDVCGLVLPGNLDERARAYQETAESACWWWPHERFVMVAERPHTIARDDAGQLHREDGPAVAWADGFGVWAWHGVRVDRSVIEEPITIERIRGERNAEVARVMIERYGHEAYLRDIGATLVARDDWGTLWDAPRTGDTPIRMVEVLNSTPEPDGSVKTYYLRIPPPRTARRETCADCTTRIESPETPLAAIAWTFGQCSACYGATAVQS